LNMHVLISNHMQRLSNLFQIKMRLNNFCIGKDLRKNPTIITLKTEFKKKMIYESYNNFISCSFFSSLHNIHRSRAVS